MSFSGSKGSFLTYSELIAADLKPGDLIEIDRGRYNHWVMFADKCEISETHWCYHVTTTEGDFEKRRAVMSSSVGSVSEVVACIRKHKLKDIIEDNTSAKPSKARINNKIHEANRRKCVPRPIQQVIDYLEELKDRTVRYNLKDLNCEHYVTTWKYGSGWSRQVEQTVETIVGAAALVSIFTVTGLIFAGISQLFSGSAARHQDDREDDSD